MLRSGLELVKVAIWLQDWAPLLTLPVVSAPGLLNWRPSASRRKSAELVLHAPVANGILGSRSVVELDVNELRSLHRLYMEPAEVVLNPPLTSIVLGRKLVDEVDDNEPKFPVRCLSLIHI